MHTDESVAESKLQQGLSELKRDSTQYVAAGLGIGAAGVASAIVGAIVCPVCIVVPPTLILAGVYKRWIERRQQAALERAELDSGVTDVGRVPPP